MNILLWVLQGLAALVFGASGVMKVFLFDKVSEGVPSFGALPRGAWKALGVAELVCAVGLVVPAGLHWHPGTSRGGRGSAGAGECRVRVGACEVSRSYSDCVERRTRPADGVRRLWPDGAAAVLTPCRGQSD